MVNYRIVHMQNRCHAPPKWEERLLATWSFLVAQVYTGPSHKRHAHGLEAANCFDDPF